jgi:hypothetical protein
MIEYIVLFIIIFAFVIFGIIIGFTYFGSNNTNTITSTTQENSLESWIENYGGYNNDDIFPPCFNVSPPAKKIFAIFKHYNIINKYKQFFNVLSMMCCQINELNKNDCTKITNRYTQLLDMNADPKNNRATLIAAANTTLKNNINSKFIIAAIYILEKHMDDINIDNVIITKQDKESIRGYLYVFYQTHIETINKKIC